jgi:predicted permease
MVMVSLKHSVRTLLHTPFVTAVAVTSLALGIGANAAIFSLFDQMLLRALPVAEPERLVTLAAPGPKPGSQSCNQSGDCDTVFSYPMFRDLERAQVSFTGIAAHRTFSANLAYRPSPGAGAPGAPAARPISSEGALVSGSYFPVLGLRPALGRLLGPDDDRTVGGHFVAVLSHGYWLSSLGGDPGVLNETIVVNGQSMTIVGVAPRDFDGATLGQRPQVFVPITMRGLMLPGWKGFDDRRSYWVYLFARLRPDVSIEQARTAINGPYRAIVTDVEAPLQRGMSDQTMARFKSKAILVEEGRRGQSDLNRQARVPLVFLLSVTAIVLLIACANIANLLLARAAGRAAEMAVRRSLGASRLQVLAQVLTEACLLALAGGLVSLVVARLTLAAIASLLPPEAVNILQFAIRWPILVATAGLSLGTGLLFGTFPAIQATRPDLVSALKGQAGQPSGARAAARFRKALVTAQIALSMALLASAGLFLKSLRNVSRVDLGLEVDRVVAFGVSPELNGYTPERSRALFARLEEELAAVPGVTGVSASMVPLLSGSNWGSNVSVQGFKAGPDTDREARFNEIGPGYFRTLGIPLLSGREFTTADALGGPKVAIVNEAFAKKFNLGRDAVGKRMATGGTGDLDTEIVGLVQNAKYSEVKQQVPPMFVRPYRQDADIGSINFYMRTSLDPGRLVGTIPAVVARLDPNLPVENLKTMPEQVRENVFLDRMISRLSAAFAGLATLLAAVGLYGVLAYTVAQRTREIGLRMALGADRSRVRALVLGQMGRLTLVGGTVGLAAAVGLGRFVRSLLFELERHDPWVLATSAVLLAGIALAAGLAPALRASRIDPMQALRYE